MDPQYPCFFGSQAEKSGHLYYSFIEDPAATSELHVTLRNFIEISSRHLNERNNLVVFFKPDTGAVTHEEWRDRTWQILQQLHNADQQPWSETTPAQPSDHRWEFCYGGTLFFVVALAPSYVLRKSRNMGPGLILLFQPRDVFANPATGEDVGQEARDLIRRRLREWDDVEVHPDLGTFGDPEKHEWKQYFLSDDVTPEPGRCPFSHRSQTKSLARAATPKQGAS